MFALANFVVGGAADVQPTAPSFAPDLELKIVSEQARQEATPVIRECRVWGPVQDASEFDDLKLRLSKSGGFPEVDESLIEDEPDYLVLVENLGSRERAKKTAQALRRVEIESYLINREQGGPVLSVGVFSRKPLAEKQTERLQKLGYEVVLQTLDRSQTVYQLTAHVEVNSHEYETSTSPCPAIAQGR